MRFIVSTAYSLKCYMCPGDQSVEDCDKDKSEMNCTDATPVCVKADADRESGKKIRWRACMLKTMCEDIEKKCKDGTYTDGNSDKIKKCSLKCCRDKDLCNGAFAVTAHVVVLSATMLLSLNMH